MENLQKLLDDVKHILEKSKMGKDEAYKRGELFNIFNVLNLTADETRTHSAFIAELLNPDGSHGLGDQFLRSFISATDCLRSWEFDTRSAEVHTEWSIGGKNDDCTEGGRLDIIIESKGKVIIIENKIYAGDQEKQLVRYYNYGRRNYPGGFRLLYLTLNGNDASKDSRGEKLTLGKDYYAISYNHEISDWLKRCIELSARHPLIRETLIQYKHLIDQLTMNDMDRNSQEELLKVMTDPKNIDSICSILNLEIKWRENIFNLYVFVPLKKRVKDELGVEYAQTQDANSIAEYLVEYFPSTSAQSLATSVTSYRNIDAWVTDMAMTEASFARLQDIIASAGELSERADFDALVDNSYVTEVYNELK